MWKFSVSCEKLFKSPEKTKTCVTPCYKNENPVLWLLILSDRLFLFAVWIKWFWELWFRRANTTVNRILALICPGETPTKTPRGLLFSVLLVHVQWDQPLISVSVPSEPQWVMAGCGVYSFSNHLVVFPVNLMSETFARPHAWDGTSNAITPGNMKKHSRSNYVKLEVYSIMRQINLIQRFMWV